MTMVNDPLFDVKDQVFILTGACGLIGRTLAEELHQRGARLVLVDISTADPESLAARYPGSIGLQCNVAEAADIGCGTRFAHIGYDFGKGGSAISRQLFRALNHVLYSPVIPFELYTSETPDVVYGNSYRLSNLGRTKQSAAPVLDKLFPPQAVGI
jgi:hypothetical protein